MRHLARVQNRFLFNALKGLLSVTVGLGVIFTASVIRSEPPSTAPVELKTVIKQIETAANRHDLEKVKAFYSSDFKNSDGLTYGTLEQGLSELWKNYKDIKYNTVLKSWNKQDDQLVAETLTKIEGTGESLGRKAHLTSTITSRQYFKDNKLVYQEILTERTEVTAGENPPQITVRLPERVKVGQAFDFDVIVQEPLGDERLAGTAINGQISGDRYLNPDLLELELLPAGGIFKRVKGLENADDQWFSAIIVRGDGIVLVTQRVNVEQ